MPNKDPEKVKQLKHEWYLKNKERLLQQKRERRAVQKKVKPPKPPKPAPTPEQEATVSNQKRSLYTFIEPGLLSSEPRADCTTTAGPTCQASTDQRESIPKVTGLGRRVCCPIARVRPWIRPDRANHAKRATPSPINETKNSIGNDNMRP